jgi:LuxR family maltose regulon positive regulatory protein
MTIPLLKTKLHIPRLPPNLTARPRLVERLDAGLQSGHRLTLVSAPAGFGKTTLLCEWIHRQDAGIAPPTGTSPRFAWLFLDDGDNDPTRFWSCVVGALRTVRPGIGETMLTVLENPEPASVHRLRRLEPER